MRKPDAASVGITPASAAGRRADASAKLVCFALMLALVALALRIVTIW
ncbi:MAG: hypothetical protein KGK01_02460 [Bradyrhizobium sp.]|nr:hypothetical protein [Bradyrhizobium sp.]MBU6463680.1 hypothetical protein [Pseudomonadota bacterium]MDE2068076.1 hypothetical protein [Bradyrhizobium sp.]MDE2241326.1 hypothetical protein [Bradyrhizobium sp.]